MATQSEVPALLRRPEVQRRSGYSRSALYEAMARGEFPRPLKIGMSRSVAWVSSEVDQWIATQIEAAQKKV